MVISKNWNIYLTPAVSTCFTLNLLKTFPFLEPPVVPSVSVIAFYQPDYKKRTLGPLQSPSLFIYFYFSWWTLLGNLFQRSNQYITIRVTLTNQQELPLALTLWLENCATPLVNTSSYRNMNKAEQLTPSHSLPKRGLLKAETACEPSFPRPQRPLLDKRNWDD